MEDGSGDLRGSQSGDRDLDDDSQALLTDRRVWLRQLAVTYAAGPDPRLAAIAAETLRVLAARGVHA